MRSANTIIRQLKMYKWKTTCNTKKIQRHINKAVREMNQSIVNDELWKGRFYVRQIERHIFRENTNDDWLFFRVKLEFVDKQTGMRWNRWYNKSDFFGFSTWRFWEDMNNFIIEQCKVWSEDPRPNCATSIDYRKVKV